MLTDDQQLSVNDAIGDLHVSEIFSAKERLLTAGDVDVLRNATKVVFIVCHADQQEKK